MQEASYVSLALPELLCQSALRRYVAEDVPGFTAPDNTRMMALHNIKDVVDTTSGQRIGA